MTDKIYKLLDESTATGHIQQGRPDLLALTRAVNALIYKDLVATQETKVPHATLFGMRYVNPDGKMTFQTPSTYSGKYGERADVVKELTGSSANFVKTDVFKFEDCVYQATTDVNISEETGSTLKEKLFISVMKGKVRLVSDAADVQYHETGNNIQEVKFNLDRWSIETKTRKFKTALTMELIQDLAANGIDGNAVVEDMLATTLSEEINKDIMQKLQTVSMRHVSKLSPEGILDLSSTKDDPAQARTVYRIISEMAYEILSETTFEASYIVCTPKLAALLSASGWMKCDPNMENLYTGILSNGIKVYIDGTSELDYLVVGTKQTAIEFEKIGSLFYSPFVDIDEAGTYHIAVDPRNMQEHVMAMARYGLSVNPYTISDVTDNKQLYAGDDWVELAGKSRYSRLIGIKF